MQKFFGALEGKDGGACRKREELLCSLCGGPIYGGEFYYRLEGQAVCETCLERFSRRYFAGDRVRAKGGNGHDAD